MILILFGAPGVGKGSQANILSHELRIPHISTGDIFRENVANNTELGKIAKEHMDKGSLVPDEITISLILDRIRKDDCVNGFIFDGFPRTLPQAEHLEQALEAEDLSIDAVVNITLEDEKIVHRLSGRRVCPSCNQVYHLMYMKPYNAGKCDKCGTKLIQRMDDTESTIRKRLQVYDAQTRSVLSYYRNIHAVLDVLSQEDIDQTTQRIFTGLGLRAADAVGEVATVGTVGTVETQPKHLQMSGPVHTPPCPA